MEAENEMKEKPKGGINKTAILVALILGLSVVGYGYLNISYKNKVFEAEQAEKTREWLAEEAEKTKHEQDKAYNKLMLAACLGDADTSYQEGWNSECKAKGLKDDCLLPASNVDRWDDRKVKAREDCFKKYPVE